MFSHLFFAVIMIRRMLVDAVENVDLGAIRLEHLLAFTVDDAIRFLVYIGELKDEMNCNNCKNKMNVQKRSDNIDGIQVKF